MIYNESLFIDDIECFNFAIIEGNVFWNLIKRLYIGVPKIIQPDFHSEFFRTITTLIELCKDPNKQLKNQNESNHLTMKLIHSFKNLRMLPDGSTSHEYANIQLDEMVGKLNGLVNGHVSISHNKEYEGNFYILKSFFLKLQPEDIYETISLDQFWIRLDPDDLKLFKKDNEEKVISGVKMTRILVLYEKTFNSTEEEDIKDAKFYSELIIEQKKLSENHKDNYKFDFCFLPQTSSNDKINYMTQQWNQI